MKIAYVGTMGIPAKYGGFETCVEEISTRLAKRGHKIVVYCGYRGSKPQMKSYEGVQLVYVPCLKNKFSDFPFRLSISTLDLLRKGFDIVHFYGSDAWPFTLVPRAVSSKTVLTLDGLVWKRSSYPVLIRKTLRLTAGFALYLTNSPIVDSKSVQDWYSNNYNRLPTYVPYGANVDLTDPDENIIEKYGLSERKYILFVGRLVHEKGVHYLIEAFNKLDTDFKLAIIGGDPYGNGYEAFLRKNSTKFLSYVYGSDFQNLCKGAYLYVTPSMLEGTSPALLTAMALGKCVLVSDIPENIETIGDAGFSFKKGNSADLAKKIQFLLDNPEEVTKIQKKAVERIRKYYDWNKISDQMEEIYNNLLQDK
jgi:glycosyltransferase involved in cell wall biosynthesis